MVRWGGEGRGRFRYAQGSGKWFKGLITKFNGYNTIQPKNKVQYDSAGVRTQTCRSGVQPAAVFVYIPHDNDQSHDILLISSHDREFYSILFIISDRDETLLHVDCHTATIKREAIQALTMIFSLPYFLQFKGITSSAGYGEPSSYRNESGRLIVEVSTQ